MLTTPLDVLKTRVMLDLRVRKADPISLRKHAYPSQNPNHPAYLSPLDRLRQIYLSEGIRALFAGGIPRTMWISAGGAVFLGMYEWTIDILGS